MTSTIGDNLLFFLRYRTTANMNPHQPKRLYCYVDETGQDAMGEFFILSVVVSANDRDELVSTLEKIERSSGKGKVKWMESRHRARL